MAPEDLLVQTWFHINQSNKYKNMWWIKTWCIMKKICLYLYFYVYNFVIKGMIGTTCVFASMTIPILDSNLILDSIAAKKLRNNAQISISRLLILIKLIALERHWISLSSAIISVISMDLINIEILMELLGLTLISAKYSIVMDIIADQVKIKNQYS